MLALVHPVVEPSTTRNLSRSSSSSLSSISHWKHQLPTFQPQPQLPRRSVSASSTVLLRSSTSTIKPPPPDEPPIPTSLIPPPQLQSKPPVSASSFDIHNYPSADLLRLLASLLTQIASTNDAISASDPTSHTLASLSHLSPQQDPSLSPIWPSLTSASRSSLSNPASALTFHARNIPTIALESYLLRILKYCPTTNEVFVALLVYFDRISRLTSEATGRAFVIDSYNVHRLVIAGVTVASKFFSDVFYTNSRYAKVGGLPQQELNQLELQFLLLNDFRLVISPDEMQRYAEQLILFSHSQPKNISSTLPLPLSSSPSHHSSTQTRSSHAAAASFITPSAPARAMGAIDAYGGSVAPDRTPNIRPARTRDDDAASVLSETDTETETEGGYTTDDEPTIRPPNSSSSCYGDAEDIESAGEFCAATLDQSHQSRHTDVVDKDRQRADITPELKAHRLVREISEDIGMASP